MFLIYGETFSIGVSQISAGSRTAPGAYSFNEEEIGESQFSLGDHRTLDEVVRDVAKLGYIPSFCTGCYRLGRTGKDFMDIAKPGEIKKHCSPNSLSTFLEYLTYYASPETVIAGEIAIKQNLSEMYGSEADKAIKLMSMIKQGKRDVFC